LDDRIQLPPAEQAGGGFMKHNFVDCTFRPPGQTPPTESQGDVDCGFVPDLRTEQEKKSHAKAQRRKEEKGGADLRADAGDAS
jgi:hypothetical protein